MAEVSVTTTPEMQTSSIDGPPITVVQPYAGAVSPPSIRSVTTSQAPQKQLSINSQAPASDVTSSPQPQPPSPASPKGKAREDSISRTSLPSPRQRGPPVAFSASQSTSDERPPSRSSMLTSPHSVVEKVSPSESVVSKNRAADNMSILSSPYSLGSIRRELPPMSPPPDRALPTEPSSDVQALFNEAGALYYVNAIEGDSPKQQPANRRVPITISEQDDSSSSESDQRPAVANLSSPATSPPPTSVGPSSPKFSEISNTVPVRQNAPMPFAGVNRKSPAVRSGSGRKPSGARELGRSYNNGSLSSSPKPFAKEDFDSDNSMDVSQLPSRAKKVPPSDDDSNLDVLAALSYLDVNGEPPSRSVSKSVEPLKIRSPERSAPSSPPPESSSAATAPVTTPNEPMQDTQFRSSFAPSKQAVERKAKVQAQQVAHHAAAHKPGRLNGRRKSKMGGAWGESSEEEEEEDDDDDDEADSDDNGPTPNKTYRPPSGNASSNTSSKPPQSQNPSLHHSDAFPEQNGHSRGLRTLPQLPSGPPHGIFFLKLRMA